MEDLRSLTVKEIIKIYKLSPGAKDWGWGECLNHLQDWAERSLSPKEFKKIMIKANKDNEISEGQDFILFNGHCFDWKEFGTKKYEIIEAFLEYFTTDNLMQLFAQKKTK